MARREIYLKQIRLQGNDPSNANGQPLLRANKLAMWISTKVEVSCANFFTPIHDKNIIIFNFHSKEKKQKVLDHLQFTQQITQHNFTLLPPSPEANESIIFVSNLPDSLFLFFETEAPRSLGEACTIFKRTLELQYPNISETHLIQHKTETTLKPPQCMQVSFNSSAAAQSFLKEDTRIQHALIRKENKSIHIHVTPKYCTICRKHSHRRNDLTCSKILVCPTCLSTTHSQTRFLHPHLLNPWPRPHLSLGQMSYQPRLHP